MTGMTSPAIGRASDRRRIVAAVVGVAALAFAARFTVGGAVLAPVGIFVAWLVTRRGNRRLSRPWSWFAAVAAVEIALLGAGGYAAMHAPPGTLSQIQHATDSAQANATPPAWMERIAPGSTARARAQSGSVSGAFSVWALVVGGMIVSGMIAMVVGTVGWLATLPIAFAITGRWIGAPPPDVLGDDAAVGA